MFSKKMDQVSVFQFLWANVIFVRDFTKLNLQTLDLFLKVAVILHDVYFSYDLPHLFLYTYNFTMGTTFSDPYREKLSEFQCAPGNW